VRVRLGNSALWRPPFFDAFADAYITDRASWVFAPAFQEFSFAPSCDPDVAVCIAGLLTFGNPATIVRFVIASAFFALDCEIIAITVLECPIAEGGIVVPFRTNADTSRAVITKPGVVWISATLSHMGPDSIKAIYAITSTCAVDGVCSASTFSLEAATGLRTCIGEAIDICGVIVSAGA